MTQSQDICSSCGKPSQVGFSGSLTQWVFLCRCHQLDLPDAKAGNTIQVCKTCSKRIGGGRAGTFTQWIFRAEVCECSNPEPVEAQVSTLDDIDLKASVKLHSTPLEIEVNKESFPIDRFAPVEILGSTWNSRIFLSIDRLLGTRVAIKTVQLREAEDIVNFQKEVKFLAGLTHPGIVKVLDFAEKDGAPYMVMEYIDGSSLRSFLNSGSVMSVEDTLHVIGNLCKTLSYCHGKNVLHRDIKPENILVCVETDPVEVKLLDFGLACTYDPRSSQGDTIAGTPLYMAPDVGLGNRYDVRSEVYSLGCVMFELLTGHPPYEADTPLKLLKLHADADIPLLSSKSTDTSFDSRLEEIVSKCMAKEPGARYQSMQELDYALEDYIKNPEAFEFEKLDEEVNSSESGLNSERFEPRKPQFVRAEILYMVLVLVVSVAATGFYLSNFPHKAEKLPEKSVEKESPFGSDEQLLLNRKTILGNPLPPQPIGPLVTDADLKKLAINHSPYLKEFIFDTKGGVSEEQLASFFRAVNLNTVTFAKDLCEPKYIRTVSNLKSLGVLRLIGPTIEGVEAIPKNKTLHTLALNNLVVTKDHIKLLTGYPRLNHLRFNFSVLDDGTIREIAKHPQIRHLSFANCSFWLHDFRSLRKKNNLRYIRLKSCITLSERMTDAQIQKNISYIKDLDPRNLILSSAADAPERAPALIGVLSEIDLYRLYLENFVFPRKDLMSLGKIKSLRKVDFRNCIFEIGAKSDFIQTNLLIDMFEFGCTSVAKDKL